jgi:class 3 adenylate cyclase/tetratricopeptide (TPR) repeat protein
MNTKNQSQAYESENRQATVMFVDIAGFTEMSEKLEAEEVTNITNACFELIGEVVERYDGEIDKFIGDSVMALFGAPKAIENSCNKALNTAIEIRNRIHNLNKSRQLKVPIDVHIGINTGKVIAGMVGSTHRKDYTVMGDAVNVASRLEGISEVGQILVGPATFHESSDDFEFRVLPAVSLKGKEKPMVVYELLSTEPKISKPQPSTDRSIYSEMVGRDFALAELTNRLRKVQSNEGSIVNVIGEPGIGKSRLIVEFQKSEELKNVAYGKGAALSNGKDLGYYPIIQILKHWSGIKEEDSMDEALLKLEKVIGNIYPEGVDEVLPFVATLMGLQLEGKVAERIKGIEGEALEQLIMKNIKELLIKAMSLRPIVFVMEDLHWADLTSIEFLESLFRLAKDHPILFINVFRPGYEDTSDRLLETARTKYAQINFEIYLERLDVNQVEQLINNLLKSETLPEEVKTAISKRTEGNPLFVEEVVSSFIDAGAIRIENGSFQFTDKISTVVVPGSIQEVFMSRLDRLDENNRSLLKEASVIGRFFFRKILSEISKHTERLDDQMDNLKKIQLIRERIRLKDIEYFFKHVLLQEVVYESILVQQRTALHLEVAKAIEAVFAQRLQEFYGVLSWHYSRAENFVKAEEYLVKAGEEALKSAASNEAITYYKEAIKLYIRNAGDKADPGKIAELEKNIAIALYNKGRMSESLIYSDRVLHYWGVGVPKNKILEILQFIVTFLVVLKHLYFPSKRKKKIPSERDNDVIEFMHKKAWALTSIASPRFFPWGLIIMRTADKYEFEELENVAVAYASVSCIFSATGMSFRISKKILDHAIEMKIAKSQSVLFFRLSHLMYDYCSGNWKAQPYDVTLVNKNLDVGDINDTSGYLIWTGMSNVDQGNFIEAEGCSRKLEEIFEVYENNWSMVRKNCLNMMRLVKLRKLDDVLEEAVDAVPFVKASGQISYALYVISLKAYAEILIGNFEDAAHTLGQATEIYNGHKRIVPILLQFYILGLFFLDIRRLENARAAGDVASISSQQLNASKRISDVRSLARKFAPCRPEAFRLLGNFSWVTGKRGKALQYWSDGIHEAQRQEMLPDLARIYADAGNQLLEAHAKDQYLDGLPCEALLQKATSIFQKFDLQADLHALEKTI